jgi:hypothetical protein
MTQIGEGAAAASTAASTNQRHARLKLIEVQFQDHHPVENDTLGLFRAPEWQLNRRADPSKDLPAQFPVCYTRKKRIKLSAKFRIIRAPTSSESVKIKASAEIIENTMMRWSGSVTVQPSSSIVTLTDVVSDIELADHVTYFSPFQIEWLYRPVDDGYLAAGSSRNPLYVTLADPVRGTTFYWTLLDISCRAAVGVENETTLVTRAFGPFKRRRLTRQRDGQGLTYWNPDTTVVTNTRMLLSSADGSGQCGSWAETLIDMYKLHGITSQKILIEHRNRRTINFLVKKWKFETPPATSPTDFTHYLGINCLDLPGIPGQRNPDPPPAFANHFIVEHGGKYYDPSYGAGPFDHQRAWESAALDGLVRDRLPDAGYHKSQVNLLDFIPL